MTSALRPAGGSGAGEGQPANRRAGARAPPAGVVDREHVSTGAALREPLPQLRPASLVKNLAVIFKKLIKKLSPHVAARQLEGRVSSLCYCYQGPGGLKYFIRKVVTVGLEYFMIIHSLFTGKR